MSIGLINPTFIPNGGSLVVGHDGRISTVDTPEFQVLGTGSDDAAELIARFSADSSGPHVDFVKSRNAAINGNSIVLDNDIIGALSYYPDDGVDFATLAADFTAEVDDASPAAGDIGTAFVWRSMPGGGGAIREVMRLSAAGDLTVLGSLGGGSIGGFTEGSVIIADAGGLLSEDNAGLFFNIADNHLGVGTASPTQILELVEATVSTNILLFLRQTAASGTGRAILHINVASGATGDPEIDFNVVGGTLWVMGVDNSQSDRFAIAPSSALGNANADVLQIKTDGAVLFGATGASVVVGGTRFTITEDGNVRMVLQNAATSNPVNIVSYSARLKTTVSDKEATRISSSWSVTTDASKEGLLEFKTANVADVPTDVVGVATRIAIRGDMVQINSAIAIGGVQPFFIQPEQAPATGAGDIVVGSLIDDLDGNVTVTGQTGDVYITELAIVTLTAPGAETIPIAATLKITGAPAQAGSAVITNAYALWVDAGNARFDGTILGVTGAGFILSSSAMAFQEATVISTSTGNLTIRAAAGADVLIGDDDTIIFVDGGTGGVGIGLASVSGTKLTLPSENDAATPTLAFGNGDSGFYESADDIVVFSSIGVARFQFNGAFLRSVNSAGPGFVNEAASATNPTLLPDTSDVDTGIGQAGADLLSLIAGATEGMRLSTSLVLVNEGSGDIDFKIKSVNIDPIFHVDAAFDSVGIGAAAVSGAILNVSKTFTDITNVRAGIQLGMTIDSTTNTAFEQNAMLAATEFAPAHTANLTAIVGLRGVQTRHTAGAASTGTLTGAAGIYHSNFNDNAGAFVLTNQYGTYIEALTTGVNNYGIYINTPTGTIADAIHVVGGRTFIGGAMRLDGEFDVSASGHRLNINNANSSAYQIAKDGGGFKFLSINATQTTSGAVGITWDIDDYTIASGASNFSVGFRFGPYTHNYTGTTTVTSLIYGIDLAQYSIVGASALTVNKATTIQTLAPIEGSNITLIDTSAIRILNSAGTPTNLYGIIIEAQTAGTNNYGIFINTPTGTIADAIHVVGGRTFAGGDFQHSGTNLGFYSIAAIAQQTGVAVTEAAIHAALVALGLITA